MKDCLFIDNHILVVFKEHNISLETFKQDIKKQLANDNLKASYLEPILPICAEASGLEVFALSSKAKDRLKKQIEEKEFQTKYLAVCVGKPKENNNIFYVESTDETFEINPERFVHINPKTEKLEYIPRLNKDSFSINSQYKFLEEKDKISLVQVCGGFNHMQEVRFVLADAKSPVFGDKLYGGDSLAKNTNLALTLVEIKMKHPVTNKSLVFQVYPNVDKKPWSYLNVEKYLRI